MRTYGGVSQKAIQAYEGTYLESINKLQQELNRYSFPLEKIPRLHIQEVKKD